MIRIALGAGLTKSKCDVVDNKIKSLVSSISKSIVLKDVFLSLSLV